jgi:tripartite-type tricarboxylate transporter receptor subunit TctC
MRITIALAALALTSGGAVAQSYPDHPVTLVVPFPAGGATDMVGRLLAQCATGKWAHPVVVANRAGAGGSVGSDTVVRAKPDGHTLLIGSTSHAIRPALYKKMPYDVQKDLIAISQLVVTPNVMVVHPSMPVKSVKGLIALARKHPGEIVDASAGVGTSNHMAVELFMSLAKVKLLHVPYKGAAPALTAVLGGEAAMTFVPINAATALVRNGRLRALAVSTRTRSPALPDIPTIAEAGVSGYEATSWTGLFVTGGTPAPIVDRIAATAIECMSSEQVREPLQSAGAQTVASKPDAFARELAEEIEKWQKVARAAGIEPQ